MDIGLTARTISRRSRAAQNKIFPAIPERGVQTRPDDIETEGAKAGDARPIAANPFRLGYLIHDISRMRRTLCDQHMKPLGITRSQWWALANLWRYQAEGVSSSNLAKALDVGKVTVSGLVGRLEQAGYVYRRPDKHDSRAKRIFVTHAGRAVVEKMQEVLGPLNEGICADMSADEVQVVERYLVLIRKNIQAMLLDDEADIA